MRPNKQQLHIIMETSSIITTIAEIAIALVGFSAIVVVLNPKPIREWHASDQFNFRVLVQLAAIVVFFAILPFGTNLMFDEFLAWKYALLAYGTFHIFDLSTFVFEFPPGALLINRVLTCGGFFVAILQILISFIGSTSTIEATYLLGLVWHLIVAFISFVILVYGMKGQRGA